MIFSPRLEAGVHGDMPPAIVAPSVGSDPVGEFPEMVEELIFGWVVHADPCIIPSDDWRTLL